MTVCLAATDEEIAACFPLLRELRPHLEETQFVSRIRSQEKSGYRLACLRIENEVVAAAGFRIGENLAWGKFLYVDDLVTLPANRSQGYGAKMLTWLREFAASEGCVQMHLDSGMQRKEAHRFYQREGMTAAGLHFVVQTGN